VIEDQLKGLRPVALIHEACNGCAECVKVCPVAAIQGQPGQLHVVDPAKCVGCRACADICPIHVIEMQPKTGKTAVKV